MLSRLYLKNFKKHADLEVLFKPGVNVICGDNYSGKSTILHGVMMALFGVSAVPGGSGQVWKRHADEGSNRVELDFTVAGVDISVSRTRSTAVLAENGEETARGISAVNRRIQELLGLSRDDFSMIKYAAQSETAALLSFGAQALRGLIERVSGADLIDVILSDIKGEVDEASGALKALQVCDLQALESEAAKYKSDLEQATAALDKAVATESEAVLNHQALLDKLHQQREENIAVAAKQEARENLELAIQERQAALKLAQEALAGSAAVSAAEIRTNREQVEQWKALNKAVSDLSSDESDLQVETDKAREALVAAKEGLEVMKRDLTHVQTVVAGLQPSVAAVAALKETLAGYRERLRAGREGLQAAVCPTCKRAYDDSYDREAEAAKVAALGTEIQGLEQKLEVEEKRAVDHAAAVKKATTLEVNIQQREQSTIPELEADLSSDERKLEDIRNQLTELNEPVATEVIAKAEAAIAGMETQLAKRQQAEGRIAELQSHIESGERELSGMPDTFWYHPVTQTQDLVDTAALAKAEACTAAAEVRSAVDSATFSLNQIQEDIEKGKTVNAKVEEYEERQATAESLRKFIKENRETFMAAVWGNLIGFASEFAANVTNGSIAEVSRKKDAFVYVENGEVMDISGASGAQRAIIGLGLKTALASAIPDSLNCLLLDEVTADMDEVRASATTSLLGSLSQQVIAVSHREMDKSGDYHIISL